MMSKSIKLLIFLGITICSVVRGQRQAHCCQEYCYDMDNERPQSTHFGSKTAYQIIKGSENGRQYLVPNCNPVKIWLLSRHGTRLPKATKIEKLKTLELLKDEILDNYEKRRSKPDVGALCEGDLDLIRHWRWNRNLTTDFAEFLTVQGWNDLKFLGIRLQQYFPQVAENIYDQHKFKFQHTNTQRAEASYKAFVEGLFGVDAYRHINVPHPPQNDSLLRPYESCPAWNNQNTNKEGSEYKKFEESDIFKQLVNDVSLRLGFRFPLKVDQINEMFDMCRFDQAWNLETPSPWCIAFTQNQVNILEYREDLETYYGSGYGYELNSKPACATISDMLNHLESTEQPQMVSYFAHASTIQLLLNAMGAAKDADPLRADSYYTQSRRKWVTSQISPYAANLVAVKYDCPNENERQKVMFFLNEKPIDFTWCRVGLCDLSVIKEKYKYYRDADCSQTFCGNSGNSIHFSLFHVVLPVTVLLILRLWK